MKLKVPTDPEGIHKKPICIHNTLLKEPQHYVEDKWKDGHLTNSSPGEIVFVWSWVSSSAQWRSGQWCWQKLLIAANSEQPGPRGTSGPGSITVRLHCTLAEQWTFSPTSLQLAPMFKNSTLKNFPLTYSDEDPDVRISGFSESQLVVMKEARSHLTTRRLSLCRWYLLINLPPGS